jgi:hypothetical protein
MVSYSWAEYRKQTGRPRCTAMVTMLKVAIQLTTMKIAKVKAYLFITLMLSLQGCDVTLPTPPYPPSPMIKEVVWDYSSHRRAAPGSDNWPVTWSDDDHQYTSWGDGGGFGGNNDDGRVSLGVARVEGAATSYYGRNIWGGKNAENPATFEGKSYGIISVGGILYMWVSPGSEATNYKEARLYRSTDEGASWTPASWAFTSDHGIIMLTFLQYGRDYQGARDTYVYSYANNLKDPTALKVQKPGEITLMRVPKTSIMDCAKYEFFAGIDSNNNSLWSSDFSLRKPVFEDLRGVGWNTSVSYNAGLGRYLLITENTESFVGRFGIYDAPEPWGPWTTVSDGTFGYGVIAPTTFFYNFSNKWASTDGKEFVLIFTGIGENDSWNSIKGTFLLFR